ncbi:MAG: hypothetical protein P0Y52_11140 [Candidatus Brevundimonas phytovorans]|nr:hypothetical protein [Brevundimonas sp.]WEK57091.1 MAG: hypothetical protein P0Y52_11140 [Brevundimonas sp.]
MIDVGVAPPLRGPPPHEMGRKEKSSSAGYRSGGRQTLKFPGIDPFSRLFASLRTLVRYGLGMTGNRDEAGAAKASPEWLDRVFDQLQAATDQAIAVVVAAEAPADVAEAEKRARAVGVLARTAKAVAALKVSLSRKSRNPEEDEMSEDDRDISDADLAGLQAEFYARVDHLVAAFERKSATAGLGREPAARAAGGSLESGSEGDAEAERRTNLAA